MSNIRFLNKILSTGKRFGMWRDNWKPIEALSLIDTNYQHIHISYLQVESL